MTVQEVIEKAKAEGIELTEEGAQSLLDIAKAKADGTPLPEDALEMVSGGSSKLWLSDLLIKL